MNEFDEAKLQEYLEALHVSDSEPNPNLISNNNKEKTILPCESMSLLPIVKKRNILKESLNNSPSTNISENFIEEIIPPTTYSLNEFLAKESSLHPKEECLFTFTKDNDNSTIISDVILIPRTSPKNKFWKRSKSCTSPRNYYYDINIQKSTLPFLEEGCHRLWHCGNSELLVPKTIVVPPSKQNNSVSTFLQICHYFPQFLHSFSISALIAVLTTVLILGLGGFGLAIMKDVIARVSFNALQLSVEARNCHDQYIRNRCNPADRVPALEAACQQWQVCMQADINSMQLSNRAVLFAEVAGQAFNTFFSQFSWTTIIVFVMGIVFLVHLIKLVLAIQKSVFLNKKKPISNKSLKKAN